MASSPSSDERAAAISALVNEHRPDFGPLIELYKYYHANPELSYREHATAAHIADQLRQLSPDFLIKEHIGGTGLVAILDGTNPSPASSEPGKTILLRADIDALPVLERTNLPFASTKRMQACASTYAEPAGDEKPVMHACGHDIHITALLGAAKVLLATRSLWSPGARLILAFQPAEERGTGARAMVDDGMYAPEGKHGVPVPDIVLGAHVIARRTGSLGTRRGLIATSADSLRVTLHGRGAHASMPHRGVDPVVMAASAILRLQTIVSREVDASGPGAGAVVTVAQVHAGEAENIIPDRAEMSIDVRATTPASRERVLARVKGIVGAECAASLAPREPEWVTTREFPMTINDGDVTAALEDTFSTHFGEGRDKYDRDVPRFAASEDFSILASAVGKPYCFFMYGGVAEDVWDRAEAEGKLDEIPANHSPFFAPVIDSTLKTGLDGYAVGALTFLMA